MSEAHFDQTEQHEQPDDPFLGTTLADKYEILTFIGGGGAGFVYKARHIFLNKIVAVKILFPHLAIKADKVQRFKQEALAITRLNHPNIVSVLDFGMADQGQSYGAMDRGLPYLVMEYVEGENLDDLIQKDGPLSVERALPLFIQLCGALAHTHSKGLVHRDLKPGNVMLVQSAEGQEQVKLIDFGLVKHFTEEDGILKLTQTGEVFGSAYYMSPEQVKGLPVDARTDVYTMGIIIFETLTGDPPFCGDDAHEVFIQQINDVPPGLHEVQASAHVRERLELIILQAMAKEPEERYQSMEALAADLAAVLNSPEAMKRTSTLWKLITLRCKQQFESSNKFIWIAMAASMALFCALAVIFYTSYVPHGPALDTEKIVQWQSQGPTAEVDAENDRVAQAIVTSFGKTMGTESPMYISALEKQARLYLDTGRYTQAETASKQVLAARRKVDGEKNLGTADALNNLATCYFNQGRFEKARPLYERGIAIIRELSGDSEELALPMSNLAQIYSQEDKLDDAVRLLEQSLSTWRRMGLAQSADFLLANSRLADVYYHQGKLPEAQQLYLSLAKDWQQFQGPQAQNTAVCQQKLAAIAEKQGKTDEAEHLYKEALESFQKSGDPNNPKVAVIAQCLAKLLWQRGDWMESIQFVSRANNILSKSAH